MSEARRTAACLAVGSELLGDHRLDSNSLTITRALVRHGITIDEKRVVGDSVERVAEAIRELFDRHDLVVVTGGLGPTADDVTRDAVARAFNREIVMDAVYSDRGPVTLATVRDGRWVYNEPKVERVF